MPDRLRNAVVFIFLFLLGLSACQILKSRKTIEPKLFSADNPDIQYFGRVDFRNPKLPRFSAPGVYIVTRFKGDSCEVTLNDEVLDGKNHNYIETAVDNETPLRVQTTGRVNVIRVIATSKAAVHTLVVCKATEAGIGYLEFVSIKCDKLLSPPPVPSRKIELIGNSITCGAGMDLTKPCKGGDWYDHNNAYLSYGAITARTLNAQYHLSSVSGIGLTRSANNMTKVMPGIYDKLNLGRDALKWDFKLYQPDVVTVCLGQNDGFQDSTLFCHAYVKFIHQLRDYYPRASIICLNSPMAEDSLTKVLKKYIVAVNQTVNKEGDNNVSHFFYSKRFYHGCGTHPDIAEHRQIAAELTGYIKQLKNW